MDYILNNNGLHSVDLSVKNVVTNTAFDSFFDINRSSNNTGVNVTPNSAMTYSSVFEAVQIISGDVARIELDIYEPDGNNREKRIKHSAYKLLNRKANKYTSGYCFRETLQAHALLWGNGFAEIFYDEVGRPKELYILDPSKVEPEIVEDELVYKIYSDDRSRFRVLPDYKMFHLKGLGFDGIKGFSVVSLARDSWGLGMSAERHGARHFKQGARPNIILKHPAHLDPDTADELAETFRDKHGGPEGVGRPAIAAGGLEVVPLSISNSDSQWLESREFQRVEVASWFSLPPHKLGDSSRIAYNSLEAEERAYASQTLMRWFERWESEVDCKLLTERQFQSSWFAEHAVEKLVQGDSETQIDTLVKLRVAKLVTQNEARHKLNLPSVEDGDTFENPATSVGEEYTDGDPVPGQGPDEQQQDNMPEVEERAKALIRSRSDQLSKTYEKQVSNLKGKPEKCNDFKDTFKIKIFDALRPLMDLYTACVQVEDLSDNELRESIQSWMSGETETLLGELLND